MGRKRRKERKKRSKGVSRRNKKKRNEFFVTVKVVLYIKKIESLMGFYVFESRKKKGII